MLACGYSFMPHERLLTLTELDCSACACAEVERHGRTPIVNITGCFHHSANISSPILKANRPSVNTGGGATYVCFLTHTPAVMSFTSSLPSFYAPAVVLAQDEPHSLSERRLQFKAG